MDSDRSLQPPLPPAPLSPFPRFLRSWRRFRRARSGKLRRRSATFTTEGTRFVLFTLAVGVAAINTGNNLFYLLVAMMLSLITMSGLLSEVCLRKLQVSCHAPEFAYAGSDVTLTLVLTNPKTRFPSFSLRLAEVVGGRANERSIHVKYLPPGGTVLVACPLHVTGRGRYDIDGIQIATPFPFGLFLKRSFLPHRMSVLIVPKPQPLPPGLLTSVSALGIDRAAARRGPGADLYNLRLYQPGDDSRLIHWMSTARTSQLIVRETEAESHPRVTISLSTTAPEEARASFERAVTLTASLTAHFHAQGFRVRLRVGPTDHPAPAGEYTLMRLLAPLALCEPSWPEPPEPPPLPDTQAPDRAGQTEPEFAVVPWSSPTIVARGACSSASFDTSDDALIGVHDGIGPGIPT